MSRASTQVFGVPLKSTWAAPTFFLLAGSHRCKSSPGPPGFPGEAYCFVYLLQGILAFSKALKVSSCFLPGFMVLNFDIWPMIHLKWARLSFPSFRSICWRFSFFHWIALAQHGWGVVWKQTPKIWGGCAATATSDIVGRSRKGSITLKLGMTAFREVKPHLPCDPAMSPSAFLPTLNEHIYCTYKDYTRMITHMWPSNYTAGYILKRMESRDSKRCLRINVPNSIINNRHNWKQPMCLSTEEWSKEMQCIRTMDYAAIKEAKFGHML